MNDITNIYIDGSRAVVVWILANFKHLFKHWSRLPPLLNTDRLPNLAEVSLFLLAKAATNRHDYPLPFKPTSKLGGGKLSNGATSPIE